MKKLLTIIFLILLANNIFSQEFYPTTIKELDATVKIFGYGKISDLEEGKEVIFQTLTFQESEYQQIEILSEALYTEKNKYYPETIFDEFGNKHLKFFVKENGDFNYEIIARIKTQALIYEMEETEIGAYPESVKMFTEKSELIESDSSEIKTLIKNKFKDNNFIETLNQVIFWVNDYVNYAQNNEYQAYYLLQKSAIETLITKKGVCDEFANLAAALLRAKNIPTRINIGPTFDGIEWGNHAWLEVYHPKYGWIPSDPTFREPGFVDGTHIKIGSFTDITLSQARAILPTKTKINFQTRTVPEVRIHSIKYFSQVALDWKEKKLKNNQWNEIKIGVTNLTNGTLTIPLRIKENHSEIIFYTKTKSITLHASESGTVSFYIHPIVTMSSDYIAKGIITINSLAEPFEINFEIEYSEGQNNGGLVIEDVVPIQTTDTIIFEIKISNNTNKNEEINISINEDKLQKKVNAFQTSWTKIEIPLKADDYLIKILLPDKNYTTIIEKTEQKIIQKEEPKETIIIQNIDTTKNQNKISIVEIILFATLLIVSFLLLLVFSIKKRYI